MYKKNIIAELSINGVYIKIINIKPKYYENWKTDVLEVCYFLNDNFNVIVFPALSCEISIEHIINYSNYISSSIYGYFKVEGGITNKLLGSINFPVQYSFSIEDYDNICNFIVYFKNHVFKIYDTIYNLNDINSSSLEI